MKRAPAPTTAAVAMAAVCFAPFVSCKHEAATSESKNVLSNAGESWCPDGFESGPNDTCFAIPEHAAKDAPVLVYLHGSYRGHGSPEEWSAVRIATQRGFAVIIPRGKRGLCAWSTEVKDHFCWPQEPEDTAGLKELIGEWEPVLWQVDALLEAGTHKRYLLGSGNGGIFASFLATHGLFPGHAFAVVNGGALAPPAKTKPVPILLIPTPDPEGASKMRELHESLAKASWAHAFCPRPGPAAMTNEDVEAALRFFKREADGALKAQGAFYSCK